MNRFNLRPRAAKELARCVPRLFLRLLLFVCDRFVPLRPLGAFSLTELFLDDAHKAATEDVYLSFERKDATSAKMQMKVVPMINALWGGMTLLITGLTIRFLVWPSAGSKVDAVESQDSIG